MENQLNTAVEKKQLLAHAVVVSAMVVYKLYKYWMFIVQLLMRPTTRYHTIPGHTMICFIGVI